MKMLIVVVVFLFVFVFFKSETWVIYEETEVKRGIEYVNMKHELQWYRFIDYIKTVYKKAQESVFK